MPARCRSLAQSLGGFGAGRPGGPEVPRRGAAKTGRITTTRPGSTKLTRASQRWAGVLVRPSMVRSSAVNGPGASPGAGWLGVACGYAAITPSGVMTERAGQACCTGVTDASMSKAAAAGRGRLSCGLALAQFIASYAGRAVPRRRRAEAARITLGLGNGTHQIARTISRRGRAPVFFFFGGGGGPGWQ